MSATKILFEACVDSIESSLAVQEGGADRIELCADLLEGGTTPSARRIRAIKQSVENSVHLTK
jgi:copper homeostasis protein